MGKNRKAQRKKKGRSSSRRESGNLAARTSGANRKTDSVARLLDGCEQGDQAVLAKELAKWSAHPTLAAEALGESTDTWHRRTLGLSVLMAASPHPALFEQLSLLLSEVAEDDPPAFQALLYYIMRAIFTQPKEAHGADTSTFYQTRLWPPYLRYLRRASSNAAVAPLLAKPRKPSGQRRMAIVIPQMLNPRHGPTQQALEFAYSAHRAGWSVLLVNADLMPSRPYPSIYRPFVANRVAELDSAASYTYEGTDISFFQAPPVDLSSAKLATSIAQVVDFDPVVVVSQNVFNFVGDLLSELFPTIYLPAAYMMAASRADLYTAGPNESMELVDGQRGVYRQQHYLALHTPEPKDTLSRLPPPAFLYAVAGTRLASDLRNAEFLGCLETILTESLHTHVLQVGDATNHLANALPHFATRLHAMPAVGNLRSVYRGCNGYLNPFRSGGGISAHIATLERVPIVSLRTYKNDYVLDVSTYVHEDAWSADPASFVKDAVALATDASFYERRVELLDEHRRQWPLLREDFSEFEEFISLAAERFEARRSAGTPAHLRLRETPARDKRSHHQLDPR